MNWTLGTGITFVGDQLPTAPQLGDCYLDQITHAFRVWNGTQWLLLSYIEDVAFYPGEYLIQEEP